MWCPGKALHRALRYSMQPAVLVGYSSPSSPYSLSSCLINLHEKHVTRHKSTFILSTCHVLPISAAHLENLTKFRGLRESQGRWEARISEGSRQAKLLFASKEEAAKAYDKAQYKLHGDRAETNFTLSEKEKVEVLSLDWEDLVLKLQLQGLPEASSSGLAFHGVHYKNQSWCAYVKKDKIRYVGIFGSMLEAIKAYDMAEYNLHGTNALLNYELSEDEAIEVERMDWDMLVEKLGLTIRGRRKHRKTGYRGVRQVVSGKWLASYYYRGTVIQLGLFEALDVAVKAYDSFAYKLCGESAKLNGCLSDDEKDHLSNLSLKEVQQALGRQATRVPQIGEMGARGTRLAQGKWEVCVESTMRDSIFLATTASEAEAAEVHDMLVHMGPKFQVPLMSASLNIKAMSQLLSLKKPLNAAYKLHKDLARTYSDLSPELRENVDSADWLSVAEKFGLQRLPSYHGVKRLVSGMWQSFLFHGGSYLPIGTFAEAKLAAYATDMCTYKLQGSAELAVYNSTLDAQEKQRVDNMTWAQLITDLREMQEQSPVIAELRDLELVAAVSEEQLTRDQRWTLYLCQEQLVQQKMMRRSPRVGQQVVVRRPELADQFSPLNRRADGSPLLIEEVMEGHAAPLLWVCECGNLFLKSPFVLTRVKLAVCHKPECTVSKERDPYTTWGSLN